jgi:type IV pilus assembly protein PilW
MKFRKERTQKGFSLIEIMIGLMIGLFVIFMGFNSLNVFQQFSRTNNSGNNALIDGTSGLYAIEHDIKMAGLGFISSQSIMCTVLNAFYAGNMVANNTAVAPLMVQRVGTTPDTLTILYGNSASAAAPASIIGSGGSSLTVNYMGNDLMVGNYALIATLGAGNPCTLVAVTGVTNNGLNTTIQYNAGGAAVFVDPTNSVVMNIGTMTWITWSIVNNALVLTDRLAGTQSIVADNIVQLKVQFGVTDGVSTTIQLWVDPLGVWAVPDLAHMARIRAVRVALIARSSQREKPTNGSPTCNATTVAPVPWVGSPIIDLSADPNWRCYRYRVLQTVIPMKNILVGGVV